MKPESAQFIRVREQLHAQAIAKTAGVDTQLSNALNLEYWQKLNPDLAVCSETLSESFERMPIEGDAHEQPLRQFSKEGYFQTVPALADSIVERMKRCIEVLQRANWPPVFAFVYDVFWQAFRGPSLVRFLAAALGPYYGQLPYFWVHFVPPNSRGWSPHVDGGNRPRLTVWLALTEATIENGCIYVVPRNSITDQISNRFAEIETLEMADVHRLLQSAKALPVPAGSFLGWGAKVVHWGSTSSQMATPRISVSVEFADWPTDVFKENLPILDVQSSFPSLSMRLYLIALAVKRYEVFEPSLIRYLAVAEQLIHLTAQKPISRIIREKE